MSFFFVFLKSRLKSCCSVLNDFLEIYLVLKYLINKKYFSIK